PDPNYAKDILLKMRFGLDLYINFRPCVLLDERLCPLKGKGPEDVQIICFRENTEGAYAGIGGFLKHGTSDEIAIQEEVNTFKGVNRICRAACQWAVEHGRTHVTMVDKSNVMTHGHDLWMRVWDQVAADYPQLECDHMYMDAMCMQLVKNPERYQVIVTNNMFGDILTDLGAMLCGGLGLAQSANINPEGVSMFEPVHGSAPKYAGQNVANPLAAILTTQLMAEHLGFKAFGAAIERAVRDSIATGNTAKDLFNGTLGTREVGQWIASHVAEHYDPATEPNAAVAV
ncbi:MAG TPA: isocitrate/isopropylmalate family dehydrogenase, partial [bacterium]|nr:isocitrate/isopropylmalate family dehydrogenase [bacterium]